MLIDVASQYSCQRHPNQVSCYSQGLLEQLAQGSYGTTVVVAYDASQIQPEHQSLLRKETIWRWHCLPIGSNVKVIENCLIY